MLIKIFHYSILACFRLPHDGELPSGKIQFDKHFLSEIAELEQDEQESNHHPSRTDDSEVYGHITFTTVYDEQEQRCTIFFLYFLHYFKPEQRKIMIIFFSLISLKFKIFCICSLSIIVWEFYFLPLTRIKRIISWNRSSWCSVYLLWTF